MLKYLTWIPEKLTNLMDFLQNKTNKFLLIVAVFSSQFLILSDVSLMSSVRAQSEGEGNDICVDVNGAYGEAMKKQMVVTSDKQQNISAQTEIDMVSKATNMTVLFAGGESTCDWEVNAQKIDYNNPIAAKGLLGVVEEENTALMLDPPTGVDIPQHFANQWLPGNQKANFSVYAQGAGYNFFQNDLQLEPVWGLFRNLAYVGFVMILVAAGFMIMFRSKIGGQVTVGVMNTIPGVIMGIILVTFSFAIVGFIVDLSRLLSFMLINMMDKALGSSGVTMVQLPNSLFKLTWMAFRSIPVTGSPVGITTGALGGAGIVTTLLGASAVGATVASGGAVIGLIVVIVLLVLSAAAFFASVKIFMMLVTTYIKLIIDLIFGPIYILMGSLPGKSAAIMEWLKRLISNALVFPISVFVFNLIRYIGSSNVNTSRPMTFMTGGNFGGNSVISMKGLVVIAGLFLMSGIPDIIQEALQAATPKGVQSAAQKAQKGAGKIPLLGGLFG